MSERQTPCTSGSIDACSSPGYTPRQQQQNYDHIQGPPSFLYPENKSYDPTASSRALVYGSLPYNYKHGQYAAAAADSTTTYLPQSGSFTYHAAAWPTSPCAHQQQQPFSPSRTDSQRRTNPYADPYYASRLDSRIERGYSCLVGATQVYYERSPHSTSFSSKSPTPSDATATSPDSGASSRTSSDRRSSVFNSVPSGFDQLLLYPLLPSPPSQSQSHSQGQSQTVKATSRFRLHIRQQPVAARACGAGDKDRRPIDPPPILQMLLVDFDPGSDEDLDTLRDPCFTVGCLLYSVTQRPPSSQSSNSSSSSRSLSCDGGEGATTEQRTHISRIVVEHPAGGGSGGRPGRAIQVLSGKSYASPFFVDEDPDPNTAPAYPTSSSTSSTTTATTATRIRRPQPAAFFVFSDLSVRTAGLYRLRFQLMNWGSSLEDAGKSTPILAEVWSEPFRVHAAKDFPGMRESSYLTERLKALGVVELKMRGKGKKGEGKGRERERGSMLA